MKILIRLTRGTYGRFDDPYNALSFATGIVAKGWDGTLYLEGEGVFAALKGQDPNDVGLDNFLGKLADFMELGGAILAEKESLEERGLVAADLIEGIEMVPRAEFALLALEHKHTLMF
jgi:sulfur relay (sulfurtransferase) DsrF/TusC family protein